MTQSRSSLEISVCIVTYGAAADLPACFAAIRKQRLQPVEVVVVDCASDDASVAVAQQESLGSIAKQVIALDSNLGFTGGMNRALAASKAPYCMLLNADAVLDSDHLESLALRFEQHQGGRVAAVTGRLRRPETAAEPGVVRLDACGMRLSKSWRHFDRGSGEIDVGQYSTPCRVFGATGAATLFRRQALADVAVDGQVFDTDFHSFREDAELCFRLRSRGWEILFEPKATAEHRRCVLPSNRRQLPAAVNCHSLKNRFLLRRYHQSWASWRRTVFPTLIRDLGAFAYVVGWERSSFEAYRFLWRHRVRIRQRAAKIRARQTAPDEMLAQWFAVDELPIEKHR